jgi:hypothetical protein
VNLSAVVARPTDLSTRTVQNLSGGSPEKAASPAIGQGIEHTRAERTARRNSIWRRLRVTSQLRRPIDNELCAGLLDQFQRCQA